MVLAGVGWHAGVIGIVAGRLAEKYHRPVVIIAWDQVAAKPGVGSARSVGSLRLNEALEACSEHLVGHGGTPPRRGCGSRRPSWRRFGRAFASTVAAEMPAADRVPDIAIDAETILSQLSLNTLQQIEQLAPFGCGNPRPILCACGVTLAGPPRRMGGGERHLSVRLRQQNSTLRGVAFGRGEAADELSELEGGLDIAFRPVINDFNGRRSVEMHLVDWRASAIPVAAAR